MLTRSLLTQPRSFLLRAWFRWLCRSFWASMLPGIRLLIFRLVFGLTLLRILVHSIQLVLFWYILLFLTLVLVRIWQIFIVALLTVYRFCLICGFFISHWFLLWELCLIFKVILLLLLRTAFYHHLRWLWLFAWEVGIIALWVVFSSTVLFLGIFLPAWLSLLKLFLPIIREILALQVQVEHAIITFKVLFYGLHSCLVRRPLWHSFLVMVIVLICLAVAPLLFGYLRKYGLIRTKLVVVLRHIDLIDIILVALRNMLLRRTLQIIFRRELIVRDGVLISTHF